MLRSAVVRFRLATDAGRIDRREAEVCAFSCRVLAAELPEGNDGNVVRGGSGAFGVERLAQPSDGAWPEHGTRST